MYWLMPAELFHRWQRQMKTPYADLPEKEKASDRDEADKMLAIVGSTAGMPPDVRETLREALEQMKIGMFMGGPTPGELAAIDAALSWLDTQGERS